MQQQNTTNRQSIIGFILISLIFVGFVVYTNYEQSKYSRAVADGQIEQFAEQASQALEEAAAQEQPAQGLKAEAPAAKSGAGVVADAEKVEEITLENEVMTIRFSTLGAQITDVTLKEYTKYAPKKERNELVKLFDPESVRFDMSFYVKNGLNNIKVNTAEHNFVAAPVVTDGDAQVVAMTLPVGEDAWLEFVYTLYNTLSHERDYLVDFDVRLHNMAPLMSNQTSLGIDWSMRTYQNERSYKNENLYTDVAYHHKGDRDISELGVGTDSKQESVGSSTDWVAFKQQFFSTTLLARSADLTYADIAYTTAEEGSGYIKDFSMRSAVPYTLQTDGYKFSFYLGPNKYAILSNVSDVVGGELQLERIIPLGWVISSWISRWVVIPVFDFLCKYISSFGLIILILTLLVRAVTFPLTYKSYLSSAKMRVLKPEIDALNAKYPKQEDAMKKQQAVMELYKKADINPMSGCLPALIQMPIFIAMFRFFPSSIELRGQSFLWSDDLSSYDSVLQLPFNIPFYGDHVSLFALLMAVVFFLYSYINYQQTASSQPQMAGMKFMMVYMMPLMMLFWFNDYASGLCYYYLLSNLFTVVQTMIMRHTLNDAKIHAKIQSNIARNTNGKKSRFQQKYDELMRQKEEMERRNANPKKR